MITQRIQALPALFRMNLSVSVALTTFVGFIHVTHSISPKALWCSLGVFLLAMAASAFNQVQEVAADSRMERTSTRPLPRMLFTRTQVLLLAACAMGLGCIVLLCIAHPLAALLGLFTLLWYNGIYTPLKKRTGYAFLAGALCGALPPIIGILAARGTLTTEALPVALFMYVWQLPHFILIQYKHRSAYTTASMPLPAFLTQEPLTQKIVYIGFLCTAATTLLFPVFDTVKGQVTLLLLFLINFFSAFYFFVFLIGTKKCFFYKPVFFGLLVYQVLIFVVLII